MINPYNIPYSRSIPVIKNFSVQYGKDISLGKTQIAMILIKAIMTPKIKYNFRNSKWLYFFSIVNVAIIMVAMRIKLGKKIARAMCSGVFDVLKNIVLVKKNKEMEIVSKYINASTIKI